MADFFEPGKTYVQAKPFRPPEDLLMFRCRLVEEHPRWREPRAFGWIATVYPGDNWASAVRNPGDWNHGWSEYDEPSVVDHSCSSCDGIDPESCLFNPAQEA